MGNLDAAAVSQMKKPSKDVVYTAVFDNYDSVAEVDSTWACDFLCFTDNPELVSKGWKVICVKPISEDPALTNRQYKILPHKYLSTYVRSLYIDANFQILSDPSPLFDKYLDVDCIALPVHKDRHCSYEEAKLCIKIGRVDKIATESQMQRYASDGFPQQFGLTENGLIFRRHTDPSIVKLMESWWIEYCEGARRDQLSLPYLLWKAQIQFTEVTDGPRTSSTFFKISLHNSDKSRSFLTQFARQVHNKKHLSLRYSFLSKAITLLVSARDKVRR